MASRLPALLVRIKEGRRNRYEVNRGADHRHLLFAHLDIGPLLDALRDAPPLPD